MVNKSSLLDTKTEEKRIVVVTSMANKSSLLDTKTEEKRIVVVTSMANKSSLINSCGLGSSVGIVTGYGLEGLGIESRWGRDFLHQSGPALGHTQPSVQWVLGLSRG